MIEITETDALSRVAAYCSTAEHCRAEVTEKLQRWGIPYDAIDRIINRLEQEKYIDEERFCRAFIHDKYRFAKWGKIKIGQALQLKKIPQSVFYRYLNEIDEDEYLAVLENSGKAALYQILADFTADCGSLLSIAVGKKCQLFQLSLSYQSALTALKYCRSSENGIAFFDDMTLEILLSSISEQEKNAYLQKTISALSDEERNLLQTYFEANMSLLGTSQKLFLHKNTVQYKLNHIYQKCGLNPRVFKDAVLLYLALQL